MKRIIFLLSVLTLVSCRKEYYFEINIPEGKIPNERNIIGKWVSFASAYYDTYSEVTHPDTLIFRINEQYEKNSISSFWTSTIFMWK